MKCREYPESLVGQLGLMPQAGPGLLLSYKIRILWHFISIYEKSYSEDECTYIWLLKFSWLSIITGISEHYLKHLTLDGALCEGAAFLFVWIPAFSTETTLLNTEGPRNA